MNARQRALAQKHTWGGPRVYVDPVPLDVFHRPGSAYGEVTSMEGGPLQVLLPSVARVGPNLEHTVSAVEVTHEPDGTPASQARDGIVCRASRLHAREAVDSHRCAFERIKSEARAYMRDRVANLDVVSQFEHWTDHQPGLGREWVHFAVLLRFDGDEETPRHLLHIHRHIVHDALSATFDGDALVDHAWTDSSADILRTHVEDEFPTTLALQSCDADRLRYYEERTWNGRAMLPFRRTDVYMPTSVGGQPPSY